MTRNHVGTTAIITGASSGIGAEFARTLAERGANLVLVARREERLVALAEMLAAAHGVGVHTLGLDISEHDATDRLVTFVRERGLTVDSLVNNAGFGMHGAFEQADAARIDEQVRLNVGALVSLTRAFLPEMTASGRGILVNVASTAAFQPVPSMAVYGATKAFVLSFTEAIAWETRETGLRVTALCPGATRTEFFDVVGTDEARVGDYQTPTEVVATAMRALDARRTPPSVVSGRGNSVSAVFARIMPRSIVLPITARVMANSRMPRRAASPSDTPERHLRVTFRA